MERGMGALIGGGCRWFEPLLQGQREVCMQEVRLCIKLYSEHHANTFFVLDEKKYFIVLFFYLRSIFVCRRESTHSNVQQVKEWKCLPNYSTWILTWKCSHHKPRMEKCLCVFLYMFVCCWATSDACVIWGKFLLYLVMRSLHYVHSNETK